MSRFALLSSYELVASAVVASRRHSIYINTDYRCQGSMKRCRKDCFWWYKKAIASNRADLG